MICAGPGIELQKAAIEAYARQTGATILAYYTEVESGTQSALPEATIVLDKFHIAKLAGEAVDQVRRQENKELIAEGDHRLKGTR